MIQYVKSLAERAIFYKGSAAHLECISDSVLENLRSYKYAGVDKSLISRYILTPYWNYVTEWIPLWMAPNLVTLLGLIIVVIHIIAIALFQNDLETPLPRICYFCFSMALFLYSTLDNCDGKQARRTNSSSPLGELFDHGVDALNCILGGLLVCSSMELGNTKIGAFCTFIPTLPMFFSSWEQYHTKVLYLGYFNGPTEGILIACSIMLISAVVGPQVWHKSASEVLPSSLKPIYQDYHMQDLFIMMCVGSLVFIHLSMCVRNVYIATKSRNERFLVTFTQWLPMILFSSSVMLWLGSPFSSLLAEDRLIFFAVTCTFVFGRITTKIILAHLTKQPFPIYTVLLTPLILGAIMVNLPIFGLRVFTTPTAELYYLYGFSAFSVICYFHWATLVISSLTKFLKINCFTLKNRQRQKSS